MDIAGGLEQFLWGNFPLRHLLNEETIFMSWWRSSIIKVNDLALCSSTQLYSINIPLKLIALKNMFSFNWPEFNPNQVFYAFLFPNNKNYYFKITILPLLLIGYCFVNCRRKKKLTNFSLLFLPMSTLRMLRWASKTCK